MLNFVEFCLIPFPNQLMRLYDFFLHLYTVNMRGLTDWQRIQTHTLTHAGLYQLF